jgi:hypothetical protein
MRTTPTTTPSCLQFRYQGTSGRPSEAAASGREQAPRACRSEHSQWTTTRRPPERDWVPTTLLLRRRKRSSATCAIEFHATGHTGVGWPRRQTRSRFRVGLQSPPRLPPAGAGYERATRRSAEEGPCRLLVLGPAVQRPAVADIGEVLARDEGRLDPMTAAALMEWQAAQATAAAATWLVRWCPAARNRARQWRTRIAPVDAICRQPARVITKSCPSSTVTVAPPGGVVGDVPGRRRSTCRRRRGPTRR